ncbi:MAG: phosphatidate cytidylyltransferase [Chitinophagaceae bacterium]|jgi:phosphatidate cytidylyltransferase|nr:phosphatidate cytidylyltransferase [Chitinophagaceae bacterium]
MAFNWSIFKTRSLTALVFVFIMLGGLFINQWSFFLLFSMIHFGCWVEYQKLVGKIDPAYREISFFHKYGVMIAGWCLMLYFTMDAFNFFGIRLHELGWWLGLMFIFLLPVIELLFAKNILLKNIGYSITGLIYISLSWGLLMEMTGISSGTIRPFFDVDGFGIEIPVIIILSIWINDTMAYIVGSLIGRIPFSKISPKKTWEGTIGGVILCVAAMFTLGYLLYGSVYDRVIHYAIIALIAAVAGTFGDLLESKLKRAAGEKDSGQLMPGHGGFLDRFDSLLLAIPFVWLYVRMFMNEV